MLGNENQIHIAMKSSETTVNCYSFSYIERETV